MLLILAALSLLTAFALLTLLSIIDLKIGLLPNVYVLGFLICGAVFHGATTFTYMSPTEMALGALTGAGLLYLIRYFAEKFYKEDALGLGDVKLMGAAGLWLGPYHILIALIIGALAGIAHGLGIAAYRSIKHKAALDLGGLSLPAGPGFAVGIALTALYVFKNFPAMVFS